MGDGAYREAPRNRAYCEKPLECGIPLRALMIWLYRRELPRDLPPRARERRYSTQVQIGHIAERYGETDIPRRALGRGMPTRARMAYDKAGGRHIRRAREHAYSGEPGDGGLGIQRRDPGIRRTDESPGELGWCIPQTVRCDRAYRGQPRGTGCTAKCRAPVLPQSPVGAAYYVKCGFEEYMVESPLGHDIPRRGRGGQ